MAVVNLTEARIRDLPMGSGIRRDDQVKGLLVICHRTTKTYAAQGDVRRNGRLVRTVRVKIDRCDRIGLREARRRAKELMSRIQSGEDPTAGPEASGLTLQEMLDRYLEDRPLAEASKQGYRYNVEKYLARWRRRAVADIARAEVRDIFDELRWRSGEATAASVMRTLRALINEARQGATDPAARRAAPGAGARPLRATHLQGPRGLRARPPVAVLGGLRLRRVL